MSTKTLAQNVAQAISDFDGIKNALVASGVSIPANTPTSDYASKIPQVSDALEYAISNGYTSYNHVFQNKTSITSIPTLRHTGSVTTFYGMFDGCTSLTSVPLFDTHGATIFQSMFYGCSSLTSIPAFNTSIGTNFNSMFYNCNSLTSLPNLNVSSGTSFNCMFVNCTHLTSVPSLDTANGTDLYLMFQNCASLVTVNGINFTSQIYKAASLNTFYNCLSLKNVTINGSIKGNFTFDNTQLTVTSLMSCINALYDYSGTTTSKTLTLGATNLAKLSAAQKATALNKGWTLA